MSLRNICALILIVSGLYCLYPGLTVAMLTIEVSAVLPLLGKLELYQATQSIIQTIETLFTNQNYLVAWLILLFSVIIPILKMLMLLVVLLFQRYQGRQIMLRIVAVIGKWSMADVFVVSVFMAYLAVQSNEAISATLHEGFYYFTAYCVLSILGTQLIKLDEDTSKQ